MSYQCGMQDDKEKVSFTMRSSTKLRLESLKARLRKNRIARAEASESGIVEHLILNADFDALLDAFQRR
jgi:hypothetical protein